MPCPDVLLTTNSVKRNVRSSSLSVFLVAVILNLTPLLYFRYIPSNDGPSHVYNAAMLRAFLSSSGDASIRSVFEFNRSIPPNLLSHSLLAFAVSFLTPVLAERTVVVLYAVSLPLVFRWLLRTVSRQTHGLEYVALPLVYNSHLQWGFYNFLFSLILFMLTLGFWLKARRHCSYTRLGVLSLSATLLYFSHPVGLFEYWITASIILLFEWARGFRRSRADLVVMAVSSFVPAVLYAHYAMTRISAVSAETSWPTLRYAASLLLTFSPLWTYSNVQRFVGIAVLLQVGLGWWCSTKGSALPINGYLAAACVTAGLLFITPTSASGGTMISPRLVYFPILLLFVWLVTQDWKQEVGALFAVISCALAIAMVASNWPYYQRYDTKMKEFEQISNSWSKSEYIRFYAVGSPSTLLLDKATRSPLLDEAVIGYSAARHGQFILGDYEGSLGYFPLNYSKRIMNNIGLIENPRCLCPTPDNEGRWQEMMNMPFPTLIALFQNASVREPVCDNSNFQTMDGKTGFTVRYYTSASPGR